jgi:polygalacturonase
MKRITFLFVAALMCLTAVAGAADSPSKPETTQLPRAMHTAMKDRPRVTVGVRAGDITGADHRALQAAVDYVASLGGGTVEIGDGEFLMRDSLHLRPHVTVRGQGAKTILRKAKCVVSALKLDGDYGEEQFTVENPAGFAVGDGVAIWDKNAGGFHTTVARITGHNGNTFAINLPLNADCMVDRARRPRRCSRSSAAITLRCAAGRSDGRGNKQENIS